MFKNFKEVIFNKFFFLFKILVLDIKYEHFRNKNNNLFYLLNNQLDYIMTYYFMELKIIKCNINKFLSNLLIKFIIKKLLYFNIDK